MGPSYRPAIGLALLLACADPPLQGASSGSSGAEATSEGNASTPPDVGADEMCAYGAGGSRRPGEPCLNHKDCNTLSCESLRDLPAGGVCVAPPEGCLLRGRGRVLDIVTRDPVPGATVSLFSATDAVFGSKEAKPLFMTITDEAGVYDATTSSIPNDPFGLVIRATAKGQTEVLTGVAGPKDDRGTYGPAADAHDVWTLSADRVDAWNRSLAEDPDLQAHLPFAERGGVVGIARWTDTGEPVEGVQVLPKGGGSSTARVRYPDATGIGGDATDENGLFIILGAGPGESFVITHAQGVLANPEGARATGATSVLYAMSLKVNPPR